ASSCLAALPQVQQVGGNSGTSLKGSTPVLFVHGINSGPGVWGPSSASSVSGQAARLRGVTAWTFSYAHQSLLWVTNRAIGPALARAITCLSAASGNRVMIVGHSMGGLATQFALGQDHGQAAADTAELITIGTPFRGSQILTDGERVINGAPILTPDPYVAYVEALLSACAGLADHSDRNPCWLASALRSPVGTALEAHSPAIAQLPAWPSNVPVFDTAGDMKVFVGVFGHGHTFDIGDGAGTLSSATGYHTAGPPLVARCEKPIQHLLSIDAGLCFHTSLPHNPLIVSAVLAAIRAQAQPTAVVDTAPVSTTGQPVPGETITSRGTAQCEAGSDTVPQAYRCFSQHSVYDPCWLDNADPGQATVLCQEQPWSTQVARFSVPAGGLASFLGPAQPVALSYPWGVQLSDGERCLAVQGTHDSFDGKVVDYACGTSYDHVLLRPLSRSAASWTYQSAYFDGTSYTPGPVEHVATAWYARPDNGAATDDRQDDCTATALAYAAQAYEAAHNNPDGALPQINAQACADGYAELVFTQSAPPPGYTASIAFRASPSGWQEIGSADFIQPGQFGMPPSVGRTLNQELASAPHQEQVAF
ncbi:MAG: esterase/lipase family protein, partial [Streptosporangiaceae bacterium]